MTRLAAGAWLSTVPPFTHRPATRGRSGGGGSAHPWPGLVWTLRWVSAMIDGLRVVGVMDIRVTVMVTKHGQDVAGLCKQCQILLQSRFEASNSTRFSVTLQCVNVMIPWKFDTWSDKSSEVVCGWGGNERPANDNDPWSWITVSGVCWNKKLQKSQLYAGVQEDMLDYD